MTQPLISTEEALDHLNEDRNLDAAPLAELERFISAASNVAERWKGWVLVPRAVIERHQVDRRDPVVYLRAFPAISVQSVTLSGAVSPLPADAAELDPEIGELRVPAAAGRRVSVAFQAGMVNVPEEYRVAVMMIVNHLWQTQRARLTTGRMFGSRADDDVVTIAGWAVPRAALELLGPQGVTLA